MSAPVCVCVLALFTWFSLPFCATNTWGCLWWVFHNLTFFPRSSSPISLHLVVVLFLSIAYSCSILPGMKSFSFATYFAALLLWPASCSCCLVFNKWKYHANSPQKHLCIISHLFVVAAVVVIVGMLFAIEKQLFLYFLHLLFLLILPLS